MAEKKEKLSHREELFILHYLESKNATDAAVKAGYSKDRASAATLGWRLLRKVEISKVIDTALTEQMRALGLSKESWLANLADCANTKKRDKLRSDALKMLGDHFGFFEPKKNSDNAGGNIDTDETRISGAVERIEKD